MKFRALGLAAAFVLVTGGQAAAVPSYFTTEAILPGGLGTLTAERTLFQSAATTAGLTLTLEGFQTSSTGAGPIPFADFTLSVVTGPAGFGHAGGSGITTEGSTTLTFPIAEPTRLEFTFSQPINAFGIDITGIDNASTLISFSDDIGNTLPNFATSIGAFGAAFFSVVNDQAFSVVRFDFAGREGLAFDNLQYGLTPVPEPASLALFGFGVAGLAGLASRRRRSA